jgi:hypothetical protein
MENVTKVIVKRIDGVYVDLHYQPVKSLRTAARFNTIEEYNTFLTGHFAPKNPDDYKPQLISITYQELIEDE